MGANGHLPRKKFVQLVFESKKDANIHNRICSGRTAASNHHHWRRAPYFSFKSIQIAWLLISPCIQKQNMKFLNFKFLFLIILNFNFFIKMLECMRLFGANIEAPNNEVVEMSKEKEQEIVPKSAERLYLRRQQFWPQNEPPPNLHIDVPSNQMVEKLKKERERVEKEKSVKGEEQIERKMPKTMAKDKEKIVEKIPKLTQRRNKSENNEKRKEKNEQKSAGIQIGQKRGRKKMKMRNWEELGYGNEEEGEGGMPIEIEEKAIEEETESLLPLKVTDEENGRQNTETSDLRRSSRVPIARKIFDPSRPSREPKPKKQKKTFNSNRRPNSIS